MADQATDHMTVSASPERCFEVVADIERYVEWAADIKEIVVEERDAAGRPLVVTWRAAAFGRSTSYTLRYDYSEAPRILSWKLTKGDITSKLDGSYVFDPSTSNGSGTDVTYHLEVELRVPIPGFIKMRAQSRIMSTALRELKARVESPS